MGCCVPSFSSVFREWGNGESLFSCSVDSDVVVRNQAVKEVREQYEELRASNPWKNSLNPTILCSQMEPAMFSWIHFRRYKWMEEETLNGVVYPKIAVKEVNNMKLIV